MIKLDYILTNLYADQSARELSDWMETHQVLGPVRRSVFQLNMHISEQDIVIKNCNVLPVGHIASNLLIMLNTRIRQEKDLNKIKELENTLSDIAIALLTELFNHLRQPRAASIQIKAALKDTCEMFNYDYSQLLRFLKLDTNLSYHNSMQRAERVAAPPRIPSYIWNGKPADKKSFIHIFSERKLFLKKSGLALLFEKPDEPLNLAYNPAQTNLTLQFFSNLKGRSIITHTGCNGFYKVLGYHIQDFEKVFLQNKTAGVRLNTLRQSKAQWNDNQRRIDSWLLPFL